MIKIRKPKNCGWFCKLLWLLRCAGRFILYLIARHGFRWFSRTSFYDKIVTARCWNPAQVKLFNQSGGVWILLWAKPFLLQLHAPNYRIKIVTKSVLKVGGRSFTSRVHSTSNCKWPFCKCTVVTLLYCTCTTREVRCIFQKCKNEHFLYLIKSSYQRRKRRGASRSCCHKRNIILTCPPVKLEIAIIVY